MDKHARRTRAAALSAALLLLASCSPGDRSDEPPSGTAIAAGRTFPCTPERVWSGDGPILCREGPVVHLAGISARDLNGTCPAGEPCPEASAVEARDYLAGLLIGNARAEEGIRFLEPGYVEVEGIALACTSTGSAGEARTMARCISPAVGDLSCAMLASGLVAPRRAGPGSAFPCPPLES